MTGYTETIRQWAADTRRTGLLANADGIGEVGLAAGDIGKRLAVRFTLKVESDVVTDARYQVFGCGFTIAACAVAADLAVGYRLDEVRSIDARQLDAVLKGLPTERSYCADLAAEALQAAVKSARSDQKTIEAKVHEAEHGPRVSVDDPVYALLSQSAKPGHAAEEDRHLFACLFAVAANEPCGISAALGLVDDDVASLLKAYFPAVDLPLLDQHALAAVEPPPERNDEILGILLSHVPDSVDGRALHVAVCFAHVLAARAAKPGHLWVAMGLFERPQLSAAIRRHLPSLAEANHQNMRWKRYLFKQVCDRNGGMMCKAPNCGVCSDYALCFAEES